MPRKFMNPITIIIAVLMPLVAGYFIYTNEKPSYQILETRTFSCPGMEGFTFQYPMFRGWEPSLDWQRKDMVESFRTVDKVTHDRRFLWYL